MVGLFVHSMKNNSCNIILNLRHWLFQIKYMTRKVLEINGHDLIKVRR
uniref:Uncharacterized protein n=1 Tax=Anguilla anguilla TaxID=7936 RepID=A0A0E9T399_ANGAN